MKIFPIDRCMVPLMLTCSLLLLSACTTPASTENQIEARAMARWDALISGDLAGAYEYLSPGYRSSVSSTQYQRSVLLGRVKWTGVKYIEDECSNKVCNVYVLLNYRIAGALPGVKYFDGSRKIDESWLMVDGLWYYVPRQ